MPPKLAGIIYAILCATSWLLTPSTSFILELLGARKPTRAVFPHFVKTVTFSVQLHKMHSKVRT
jgi:hypothetical protein